MDDALYDIAVEHLEPIPLRIYIGATEAGFDSSTVDFAAPILAMLADNVLGRPRTMVTLRLEVYAMTPTENRVLHDSFEDPATELMRPHSVFARLAHTTHNPTSQPVDAGLSIAVIPTILVDDGTIEHLVPSNHDTQTRLVWIFGHAAVDQMLRVHRNWDAARTVVEPSDSVARLNSVIIDFLATVVQNRAASPAEWIQSLAVSSLHEGLACAVM